MEKHGIDRLSGHGNRLTGFWGTTDDPSNRLKAKVEICENVDSGFCGEYFLIKQLLIYDS